MFGVNEIDFDVHPEFMSVDSSDVRVVNGFLRRALVTALFEQNIQISERMHSGLSPFSVSASLLIFRSRCVVAVTSSVHIHDGDRESAGICQGLGVSCTTVPA